MQKVCYPQSKSFTCSLWLNENWNSAQNYKKLLRHFADVLWVHSEQTAYKKINVLYHRSCWTVILSALLAWLHQIHNGWYIRNVINATVLNVHNSTLNNTIIAVPQCIGITVPTPADNHNAHQKPDGKFEEFRKHPQMVRDGHHGTRENCRYTLPFQLRQTTLYTQSGQLENIARRKSFPCRQWWTL